MLPLYYIIWEEGVINTIVYSNPGGLYDDKFCSLQKSFLVPHFLPHFHHGVAAKWNSLEIQSFATLLSLYLFIYIYNIYVYMYIYIYIHIYICLLLLKFIKSVRLYLSLSVFLSIYFWKRNFHMTPHVHPLLVVWWVGLS